jgi:fatty-acid desaturase
MNATRRLHFPNIFWLALAHVMAALAIFHFSWPAFILCMGGVFVLSPLGINLGYHRLLTHRSLKAPQWLEYSLVTLGATLGGGPPLLWVAEHRLHHTHSDTHSDPHNSLGGFWYSHVGHLFFHKEFEDREDLWLKYVTDLSDDRYYRFLNTYWIMFAVAALIPVYYFGGLTMLLWVGFVRVVLMLHITWFVNSASHLWGYQNYKRNNESVNCWWVGILAAGEGWHNNHHAYPTSAAHGHKWWELDLTYGIICGMERVGLASNVRRAPSLLPPIEQPGPSLA